MVFSLLFLLCVLAAVFSGILSGVSDVRGLEIPNLNSVIVIVSFFVAYGALWGEGDALKVFHALYIHVLAALIMFVVTFVMFAVKMLGAGDSKLATAYAFWLGLSGIVSFLFVMTFVGALLALIALAARKWNFCPKASDAGWIGRLRAGENAVPYGVAIAAGAVYSFYDLGYFSLSNFL